jgi:2-oxoglutarate dehydrogenase E1 component
MKKSKLQQSREELEHSSFLSGENDYIDSLYEDFLKDESSVDEKWQAYFSSLGGANRPDVSHLQIKQALVESAKHSPASMSSGDEGVSSRQECVDGLIYSFRHYGHYQANLDPLGMGAFYREDERLSLQYHQLSDADLQMIFMTRGVLANKMASLSEIFQALQGTYCSTAGFEFNHVDSDAEQKWLIEHIEAGALQAPFDQDKQRDILYGLSASEGLEKYLDVKYPGQKRFSIEGLETLIPMLNDLANDSKKAGFEEVKIAMAHRGRLNVLVNVLGQSPQELYEVFDGNVEHGNLSGDVKYHLGYSSDVKTQHGCIHFSMLFNPSHLEFINPVAMGAARAKRDCFDHINKSEYALLVLLHGDAAFVGQGVVAESLGMSKTRAYDIGGTIHIVTNNQIGFTTSSSLDARTSFYCTGPAKAVDMPIFHVNADDPEMAVKIIRLAFAYRMKFFKDVVIDLVGFRRHGHQEVDEPRATQPMMYQYVDKHPGARAKYVELLQQRRTIDEQLAATMKEEIRDRLDRGEALIDTVPHGLSDKFAINWAPYLNKSWDDFVDTTLPMDRLVNLAQQLHSLPEGFHLHRSVEKIIKSRALMAAGEMSFDWGAAETLAYASLLEGGFGVRLVGEDALRGTFYHRHATVFDQDSGEECTPLANIAEQLDVRFTLHNSMLSETGALGFEYGYSMTNPNTLVLWEAQFGDFANVAQVIVDQFISSAWQKWQRLSGLVMLLPHGYEGMGPEHSSARLERYLQLAAQQNIQICVPSTPAQIFHLLRRQMLRAFRVPLIVMTPKSLLRHKLAVSSLEDLSHGKFELVLPEIDELDNNAVTRVIACSGKIYYELLTARREQQLNHIAIARIEQLYPFPYDEVKSLLKSYPNATELVWCQEEPKNQGAWFVIRSRLEKFLPKGIRLLYSCRVPMAAPSAGHIVLFKKHQAEVTARALSLDGMHPHEAMQTSVETIEE